MTTTLVNHDSLDVSVVVPISERHDSIKQLYSIYEKELRKEGLKSEFIFVIDGNFPTAFEQLKGLKDKGAPIHIIKFATTFGESNALLEGFRHAKADKILTLASYIQIEPSDLSKIFNKFNEGCELVITRRYPRKDPLINRIQSQIYHFIVRILTGTKFKDITSGTRLFSKDLLSEFVLYGDLHRFIPVFATQKGIDVKEVKVGQREEDTHVRLVKPGVYLRRLLDLLTVFFLVKFTKKPLRFFGLIGLFLFVPGAALTVLLGVLRLFDFIALSHRPALLLGVLLMVFGIQLLSVGLVGELIIFGQPKTKADYRIKEIIE